MALKVYVDRLSQPSRALLIFCKMNNIEFEEVKIEVGKGQHKSPQFKEINPMGQVPAIVHGELKLFESHAILRYLASAFPEVSDNWFPADLVERAKVDSILDWHHSNLRRGSAPFVLNTALAPLLGLPSSPQAAEEAEKLLRYALMNIESIWLKGDAKFLLGNSRPSLADISLVCEIMQLELVNEEARERILYPHKKVMQWVENVKSYTSPHFEEMHELLYQLKEKLQGKASS